MNAIMKGIGIALLVLGAGVFVLCVVWATMGINPFL